jgi:hypothetical protein
MRTRGPQDRPSAGSRGVAVHRRTHDDPPRPRHGRLRGVTVSTGQPGSAWTAGIGLDGRDRPGRPGSAVVPSLSRDRERLPARERCSVTARRRPATGGGREVRSDPGAPWRGSPGASGRGPAPTAAARRSADSAPAPPRRATGFRRSRGHHGPAAAVPTTPRRADDPSPCRRPLAVPTAPRRADDRSPCRRPLACRRAPALMTAGPGRGLDGNGNCVIHYLYDG